MDCLLDKVALITGASRGIGAAVAERFAREGAHLVLAARTVGGLEEVDDKVRAAGGSATLVPLDLRDFVKIDELAARILDRWGRLDILVGNAAEFGVFSPLGHIDPATWSEVIDLNLTANWRLIRAMDPLLRAAPGAQDYANLPFLVQRHGYGIETRISDCFCRGSKRQWHGAGNVLAFTRIHPGQFVKLRNLAGYVYRERRGVKARDAFHS